MKPTDILHPDQRKPSRAYLADGLRKAVFAWRNNHYEGASDTTKRLLQYWFDEDHIVEANPFEFWFCQREAVESLIYGYEVLKKRIFIDLAREFGKGPIVGYDPSYDQYPLYAFKMATASGKTFVMALAIIWSYFNHYRENDGDYTSKFLLISPNIIVYERLKRDFKGEKGENIFKAYPFIPPEWEDSFNLRVILRDEPIGVIPEDALFLTNIQRLEERGNKQEEVGDFLDETLVLESVQRQKLTEPNRIREVLSCCPNVMILKDEAHHIYKVENAWKKILLKLHKDLEATAGKGINMELDFSATPKTETGAYFPWIIEDFTLKEAIEMDIVKRPLKGTVKKARETASDKAHEKYMAWIDAGVRRWREYKTKLSKVGRKPILFLMCEDTTAANDVYDYLQASVPDLTGKILLIHTKLNGDIVNEDLDEAREAAKKIDEPDSPYDAIVSVMMLNEGWDVRNVTVTVGLRSYGSKRKVLPEQVIGRGLRKMFTDEVADPKTSVNILEVIGPPALTEILDRLEAEEGIQIAEFDTSKPIDMTTIFVDENKLDKDIEIPVLSPRVRICHPFSEQLEPELVPPGHLELGDKVLKTQYIAQDMLTKVVVVEREWNLPVPQDTKSVIAYYTQKILKELHLPTTTNFPLFYPLVKDYVERRLFKEKVSLDDPRVLYTISEPQTEELILNSFTGSFRELTFKEEEPRQEDVLSLKSVKPFVWTRPVYTANKCILNYVPCGNDLEVEFVKFLDRAEDVEAFTKNEKLGFFLEYISSEGGLKNYKPDFIVRTTKGKFYILETKGEVDINVPTKDDRARIWCDDASKITGQDWHYERIDQQLFEAHYYDTLQELIEALPQSS
ncbi:MAG: DEAD/DEAH box helicase family protein [Dehalococcoidales bacterium]|nr:DEAD/DEAH box helicase family protein [Dehalococcoidales bacterium]